jgi:hypothetical protein
MIACHRRNPAMAPGQQGSEAFGSSSRLDAPSHTTLLSYRAKSSPLSPCQGQKHCQKPVEISCSRRGPLLRSLVLWTSAHTGRDIAPRPVGASFVSRWRVRKWIWTAKASLNNVSGNLILPLEQIRKSSVILYRANDIACFGVAELSNDPKWVPAPQNTTDAASVIQALTSTLKVSAIIKTAINPTMLDAMRYQAGESGSPVK